MWAVFCAFMIGTAGAAILPSIQKWRPRSSAGAIRHDGDQLPNRELQPELVDHDLLRRLRQRHHQLKQVGSLEVVGVVMLESFVVFSLLLLLLSWH